MRLRDIMLSAVPPISAGASAQEALDQIGIAGQPSLVVMDQKEVVGVVSESDLRTIQESDRYDRRVRDVSRTVAPLSPEATIKEAANLLRSHNVERIAVVEEGHLVGVVTVGRLLELIGRGAVHAAPNKDRVVLAKRGTKRDLEQREAPRMLKGRKGERTPEKKTPHV